MEMSRKSEGVKKIEEQFIQFDNLFKTMKYSYIKNVDDLSSLFRVLKKETLFLREQIQKGEHNVS